MTVKYEIEIELGNEKYRYLAVDFVGEPRLQNDSFDYAGTHCTHGRAGTCHLPSYYACEDITWDTKKHTEEENIIIDNFLSEEENFESVEDLFCRAYQND